MKSRIRRKNVQKSIRRKNVQKSIRHSQRGGGKKFEFSFYITTGKSKRILPETWNSMGGFDGFYYHHGSVYLEINVKNPREESKFRQKQKREDYLFDVKFSSRIIPQPFDRLNNKNNLTRDELVSLFFETYESDKIIEVSFMKELIFELESKSISDAFWSSDKLYLKGLSYLVVGLREELDRRTHPHPPPPAEHFTSKKDTRAFTPKKYTRAFTSTINDTRDWLSETGKTWPKQMVPPPKYQ